MGITVTTVGLQDHQSARKGNGDADGLSRQAWEEDEGPDALHGEKGGVLEIFQPRRAPTTITDIT